MIGYTQSAPASAYRRALQGRLEAAFRRPVPADVHVDAGAVAVNVLWTADSPPPARLAELGVARVSVGGGLFAAALQATEALAARLQAGDPTALVVD